MRRALSKGGRYLLFALSSWQWNEDSLKNLFHLVEQRAADRLVLDRGCGAQLLQQFALPLVEFRRRLHFHFNVQIAASTAVEHRHAFTLGLEGGPCLRAFGDLQRV